MVNANWLRSVGLLLVGALMGGLFVSTWERSTAFAQRDNPQATPANPATPAAPVTPATMQADVAHLKDITPPNSHPMVDVAMFAANLWFASQKKNWPLANYYLGEMRNRMRWEVRVNPGPKGADGKPVDMQSIFDGIDNGSLMTIKKTIDMKDSKQFAADYKHLLEDCYSCHMTLFDLTGRKRAEEAIRRSEERYRRLFERNLAGVKQPSLADVVLQVIQCASHFINSLPGAFIASSSQTGGSCVRARRNSTRGAGDSPVQAERPGAAPGV